MTQLTLHNREATMAVGKKMAPFLQAGDVIVLNGDLGAGLGISDVIKSPTFTIIREYQSGRLPLYHMDIYRLENGGAEDLGLEEYFDGDGISVVEWAEFIEDELPTEFLAINFKRTDDEQTRELSFEPHGRRFESLVKRLVADHD